MKLWLWMALVCCTVAMAEEPVKVDQADEMVKHTNAYRVRNGLQALEADPKMMAQAQEWAVWMHRNGSLNHSGMPYGENIAMGSTTGRGWINQWINSSGHRANILSNWDKIGCGYSGTWACQIFAGKRGGVDVTVSNGSGTTYRSRGRSRRFRLFGRRRRR